MNKGLLRTITLSAFCPLVATLCACSSDLPSNQDVSAMLSKRLTQPSAYYDLCQQWVFNAPTHGLTKTVSSDPQVQLVVKQGYATLVPSSYDGYVDVVPTAAGTAANWQHETVGCYDVDQVTSVHKENDKIALVDFTIKYVPTDIGNQIDALGVQDKIQTIGRKPDTAPPYW